MATLLRIDLPTYPPDQDLPTYPLTHSPIDLPTYPPAPTSPHHPTPPPLPSAIRNYTRVRRGSDKWPPILSPSVNTSPGPAAATISAMGHFCSMHTAASSSASLLSPAHPPTRPTPFGMSSLSPTSCASVSHPLSHAHPLPPSRLTPPFPVHPHPLLIHPTPCSFTPTHFTCNSPPPNPFLVHHPSPVTMS